MGDELNVARNALEAALGEYMDACLASRSPGVSSKMVDPESPSAITSALLAKEYLRVASLEKQIQQAKAAIITSRNGSSNTTLVNTLPVEVLALILQLAAKSGPCKLDPWSPEYERLPDYPIQLTHVCAHWRQLIIGTPFFWSHIDVTPLLESRERLRERTQTFITRAGRSPLDIHITEFLAPLVPRMQSLDLDIQIDEEQEDYDPEPSARDFCSTNSTPGTLTQLSLEMETNYIFLVAIENAQEGEHLPVEVSAQHLEEIWRHVSVLKLNGLFPFWTSSAYHGLVELSLVTGSEWRGAHISEHHLAGIFSSSPRLRVVKLGLPIIPSESSCKATTLISLEALILYLKTTNELESIMRLIIPGQKPLRVTIPDITRDHSDEIFKTTTETAKFFARSNVIMLHFSDATNYFKILCSLESIENVAFTIRMSGSIDTLIRNKPLHVFPRRLYLLSQGALDLEIGTLRGLIRVYAPKNFTLWGPYRIFRVGEKIDNIAEIEEELSISGTTAKVMFSKPPLDVGDSSPHFEWFAYGPL
ncbi:hypothetical protein B0J17DRAFT_670525 [Rhizoctonia solani]|nr:hypothetical protein B0J17DRAFT_670525 [Rhizoctonia solani]